MLRDVFEHVFSLGKWDAGITQAMVPYFNGLMPKRRNSVANIVDLHLFCINPSILEHK